MQQFPENLGDSLSSCSAHCLDYPGNQEEIIIYYVSHDQKSFIDAQQNCESLGLNLGSIQNSVEKEYFLTEILSGSRSNRKYWIGKVQDQLTQTQYQKSLNFKNLAPWTWMSLTHGGNFEIDDNLIPWSHTQSQLGTKQYDNSWDSRATWLRKTCLDVQNINGQLQKSYAFCGFDSDGLYNSGSFKFSINEG